MGRYIGPFDTLNDEKMDIISRLKYTGGHTMSTYKRSSRTSASCISRGTRSRVSCLAFPLALGGKLTEVTRELSGALAKEVSAMKDGSFWAKVLRGHDSSTPGL